ncbi:hypothetical protein A3715_13995 [Oleiphilus sp. HI0009]|nr:hypothetical protein A3715_13995 [Oleiphilus sp. HI0009]
MIGLKKKNIMANAVAAASSEMVSIGLEKSQDIGIADISKAGMSLNNENLEDMAYKSLEGIIEKQAINPEEILD